MKNLFIVDLQNDFLPGGALGVENGDKTIPYINELLESEPWDKVFISKDWHPEKHISFAKDNKVPPFTAVKGEIKWPTHCVQGTKGAELNKELKVPKGAVTVLKGNNPNTEEYSGAGRVSKEDTLDNEFVVVGLATDYCVKNTAIGLASSGAKVTVDLNGCRGVTVETTATAINDMKRLGIKIIEENKDEE